jgi:peptide/nickel transport system permease protein
MSASVTTTAAGVMPRAERRRLNTQLRVGLSLLGVLALVAAIGPLLLPSAYDQHIGDLLQGPSPAHPLGTDGLGRDVLARVVVAIRIDLLIGIGALVVPFLVGTLLGALAGWRGGRIDSALGVLADVVQAFPYYLLIIVLVFFLGASVGSIFVAVAVVAWVSYMRIVRASVQSARRQDYVAAALGGGLSQRRVLMRHVLPNVVGQPIAYLMTDVVVVIISTATLSYLGLGIAPPTPEIGSLIADGQQFIGQRPLLSIAPGVAVVLIGTALALVGNGVQQRMDEG